MQPYLKRALSQLLETPRKKFRLSNFSAFIFPNPQGKQEYRPLAFIKKPHLQATKGILDLESKSVRSESPLNLKQRAWKYHVENYEMTFHVHMTHPCYASSYVLQESLNFLKLTLRDPVWL